MASASCCVDKIKMLLKYQPDLFQQNKVEFYCVVGVCGSDVSCWCSVSPLLLLAPQNLTTVACSGGKMP